MSTTPEFPTATRIRGRIYFDRFEVERFKRALLGLPALERDPRAPTELVTANQFSEELGRHRRTLGRRLVESQRAAENAVA